MSSFNISRVLAKAKEVYDDVHTQWLESDEIGVNIKLYYPSTFEDCVNCEHTHWGGITYKAGGPAHFNLGNCPVCGSSGDKKEVEVSETVKLRVYNTNPTSFNKSNLSKLGISIDQPQGELLTIGSIDDLQKIKSCNYATFYSDQEGEIGSLRYKISSEPQPHGFGKDMFFFCFWNRV